MSKWQYNTDGVEPKCPNCGEEIPHTDDHETFSGECDECGIGYVIEIDYVKIFRVLTFKELEEENGS